MTTTIKRKAVAHPPGPADMQYCHDYFEGLFKRNFFKCLNDENRQRIILLVGQTGEEGMRVADIAANFDLDRTTISHHLTMMRDSGLLKAAKRGKERYYSVNLDYITDTLEEMTSIFKSCCGYARGRVGDGPDN